MKPLASHFFVSSTDGNLYDTRNPNWHTSPVRVNYSRGHREIKTLSDMKASLRAGPFAWPGGYNVLYVTRDGGLLCSKCAEKQFRQIAWDFLNDCSTGWRVEASCIEAVQAETCEEDLRSYCSHCSEAFGELS